MSTPAQSASDGPSDRVRLAGLAAEAALGVSGVARLDAGPAGLFATISGTTRVAGVTSAAAPEGGYDVSLRLVCELVALGPVGDAVRAAVQKAGHGASIDVQAVTILIADVDDGSDGAADGDGT